MPRALEWETGVEERSEAAKHERSETTMKVLVVTNMWPTARNPSSGTFVEQQVQGLRRIGLGVDVEFEDRASRGARAYLGMKRRIRERVREARPDLVHVMYGGVIADLVTQAVHDRPVIVSFCGSDLLGEPLSPVRRIMAWYGVHASRRAARRAAGIVVKARILQEALPPNIPREKIRIIPNGIDVELFKPLDRDRCRQQLGWARDRFHVLFPGYSMTPRKRTELAEAAIEALKQSGVPTEGHLLKGIPHREVPLWLNASDVLLFTSSQEGSPNVVKEALACSLPVVSVDVGDVRERMEGIHGCYLASPDAGDLGAKLTLVYKDGRRTAGHAAMRELSLDNVARQLRTFYRETLEGHAAPC